MKKILFIVQLPPPTHGASIMNEFVVNSSKIAQEFQRKVLPLSFAASIDDIGKFSLRKVFIIFKTLVVLIKELVSFRPQIIYYTLAPSGFAFWRDAFFVSLIKLFNCKIVFHLHGKGIIEEVTNAPWKKIVYRSVFKRSFPICLTHSLYKDLSGIHTGKYYVLNNGIPPLNNVVKTSVPDKNIKLLYLSSFIKSKGILTYLSLVKKLSEKGISFHAFAVGGDGDITVKEVKEYVQKNNLEKVLQVMGPLYGDAKLNILSTSDIFIFPSTYKNEAFPLSLLEAMRAQLCVVTSNNGGIPEMIDHGINGFICESSDTDKWVSTIEKCILDREKTKEMGRNALQKYLSEYTLEKFELNLLTILRDVVKQ